MSRASPTRVRLMLVAAGLVLGGCSDGISFEERRAVGHYQLITASGLAVPIPGPSGLEAGWIRLGSDGSAERVRVYRHTTEELREEVAVGTFKVSGSQLTLEFRELDGACCFAWSIGGHLSGDTLALTSGHPADGPDIVEVYVR